MPPVINEETCVGCGVCATICPMRVFVRDPAQSRVPEVRFGDECWHCLACELECKQGAVTVRLPLPLTLVHVDAAALRGEGGRHA